MKTYKGTGQNLQCRGFQYEVGKPVEIDKTPVRCTENGFHACENPMDVLSYYSPDDSRYFECESEGQIDKSDEDTKIASSKITLKAEINLFSLIKLGVEYILSKVNWKDDKESNTGYRSAATNTGDHSAATNTGDHSAATNTGDQSAATVEGKESVAMAIGYESKAKGTLGCWLVLAEWFKDDEHELHIKDVQSIKVDGETIKAGTFYQLEEGKFIEVE